MALSDSAVQGTYNQGRSRVLVEKILSICQSLNSCLKRIEADALTHLELEESVLDRVLMKLFSRLCSHYLSYVSVTLCEDEIGSLFLSDRIYETAITLTYLVEEGGCSHLEGYIQASVVQTQSLLRLTEASLKENPDRPELLKLSNKLKFELDRAPSNDLESASGLEPERHQLEMSKITKTRATKLGLKTCFDPSRGIILKAHPASWLDLQLNSTHADRLSENFDEKLEVKLQRLREISHLCIHTAGTFLNEIVGEYQSTTSLYKELSSLFSAFVELDSHPQ